MKCYSTLKMNLTISIVDQIEQLERQLYVRGGRRPEYLVLSKSAYRDLKEERGIPATEEIPMYRGYFIYLTPTEDTIIHFR